MQRTVGWATASPQDTRSEAVPVEALVGAEVAVEEGWAGEQGRRQAPAEGVTATVEPLWVLHRQAACTVCL
jgi:hypothetical protein